MKQPLPTEFERKYLVHGDDWNDLVLTSKRIRQGYVANNQLSSTRVRIEDGVGTLTIKGEQTGIGREEINIPVPADDANRILSELVLNSLEKTRHILKSSSYEWTIDVFESANEGLIMLEIEHTDFFELDSLPSWVGREITFDPKYKNSYLSEFPFTTWPDKIPNTEGN